MATAKKTAPKKSGTPATKKVAAKKGVAPAKKAAPGKAAPAKKVHAGADALAKARAARAAGKSPAKKSAKRPGLPLFKAPADFKPFFLEVQCSTEKDGLFAGDFSATRFKGRFDNENTKTYDLAEYDPVTLVGLAARLSAPTFAPNIIRRLPINTKFKIMLRVAKKAADNSLTATIKFIQIGIVKDKKVRFKMMDKTDPVYRKLRRTARTLPAAFSAVMLPPSGRKAKTDEE